MPRFELTINPEYVPHWSIQDALRELIQNALDEVTINSENDIDIDWNNNVLCISTKNASLNKASLLIGSSTKRTNSSTIGKEGEGYKLACLVLTRNNNNVIIHNYHEKEKWIPKIIKSRRYNSKLLVIDTEKFIWSNPPNHDLTFEVQGITKEDYNELIKRTLYLQGKAYKSIKTENYGEVLLDDHQKGRIYVNGLYITTIKDKLKYGYSFHPSKIELDRDRRTVSNFNLSWATSLLWSRISYTKNISKLYELIKEGYMDVEYIQSTGINQTIVENQYENFVNQNGITSYPVSNQTELEEVSNKYNNVKAIITNELTKDIILESKDFKNNINKLDIIKNKSTISEDLVSFKNNFLYLLNDEAKSNLDFIIEKAKAEDENK